MKYLKWLVAVCLLVVLAPSCSESDTNKVRFVIALITLEIHVNGKLKKRASGNGWVTTGDVRIKK